MESATISGLQLGRGMGEVVKRFDETGFKPDFCNKAASGFKGISNKGNRYVAKLSRSDKTVHLGYYDTPEGAIVATKHFEDAGDVYAFVLVAEMRKKEI